VEQSSIHNELQHYTGVY